jgi:hypothetical protein
LFGGIWADGSTNHSGDVEAGKRGAGNPTFKLARKEFFASCNASGHPAGFVHIIPRSHVFTLIRGAARLAP